MVKIEQDQIGTPADIQHTIETLAPKTAPLDQLEAAMKMAAKLHDSQTESPPPVTGTTT